VSDATGIPFTRETVHKGLLKDEQVVNEATLQDSNRYSLMVTGGNLYNRSIMDLRSGERWCAPRDFVQQMARKVDIQFNAEKDFVSWGMLEHDDPTISTIPMPFMMKMFGWRDIPDFKYLPVWTIKAQLKITSKVCQTIYQTEPLSWYRATLHGQELTLEFMFDPANEHALEALWPFGVDLQSLHFPQAINKIPIGKIQPIDETVRKRFLLWLTEKHNIYSLGRFATWRNILLDDIVKDVKQIESMIERQHTYEGHIN
jgi:hypothetical protein